MNFQINSSKLFLTYPRCDLSKDEALYLIDLQIQGIKKYLIATERHQNGLQHLHIYLELEGAFRTRNERFADIGGFHGNYQSARSAKNVVKYCSKEEDFISNFDINEMLPKRGKTRTQIGKEILEGKSLTEVVFENPSLLFGYAKLKQDLEEFTSDVLSAELPDLPSIVPNPWGETLPVDTDNKKCHYWFWSTSPNRGKTTGVILPLVQEHGAVIYDPAAIYHQVRPTTKILVMDEVKRDQIKYEKLNKMCDGTATYRGFMKGEFILKEKPLIVICSNFSINECFGVNSYLVESRFIQLCVESFSLP